VTVDPSLAELSDTLFSIAVALYSVAVVAFSAQLAFGRRPARQLVPAGGGGAGGSAGDTAPAATSRTDRWGLIGLAVTVLGALVHAGVLVTRGMAADRLPWGNMYEFATAVVLVGVVVYLVLAVRIPAVRDIGAFVLAPVVLALVATGLFLYTETGPLVAALRAAGAGAPDRACRRGALPPPASSDSRRPGPGRREERDRRRRSRTRTRAARLPSGPGSRKNRRSPASGCRGRRDRACAS